MAERAPKPPEGRGRFRRTRGRERGRDARGGGGRGRPGSRGVTRGQPVSPGCHPVSPVYRRALGAGRCSWPISRTAPGAAAGAAFSRPPSRTPWDTRGWLQHLRAVSVCRPHSRPRPRSPSLAARPLHPERGGRSERFQVPLPMDRAPLGARPVRGEPWGQPPAPVGRGAASVPLEGLDSRSFSALVWGRAQGSEPACHCHYHWRIPSAGRACADPAPRYLRPCEDAQRRVQDPVPHPLTRQPLPCLVPTSDLTHGSRGWFS